MLSALVLFFAVFSASQANAQVQSWTVTAQCDATIDPLLPCSVPGVINATMTTQITFGNWSCPICINGELTGNEPAITGISGTFDGMAMNLIGTGGWMYENNPQQGFPQNIVFSAGGTEWLIYYDVFPTLTSPDTGLMEDMDWSAPDPPAVPEPGIFLLLALGLFGLLLWRRGVWFQATTW